MPRGSTTPSKPPSSQAIHAHDLPLTFRSLIPLPEVNPPFRDPATIYIRTSTRMKPRF